MRTLLGKTAGAMLAAAFISSTLWAADGTWHSNFDRAWDTADAQGKAMLVYVTRPGCPYCTQMKNTTLADKQVQAEINQNFVPVWIDAKTSPNLVKQFGVAAFPSTVVITPDGVMVAKLTGLVTAPKMKLKLAEIEAAIYEDTAQVATYSAPVATPRPSQRRVR